MNNQIIIPTYKEFTGNKKISDRIYTWILLNSNIDSETGDKWLPISRNKCMTGVGVRYETYIKKIGTLVDLGYIEKTQFNYVVSKKQFQYGCKINLSTAQVLLDSKMDNIIKLYAVLKRLYETNHNRAWFNYKSLYSGFGIGYAHQGRDNHKTEEMLKYLQEHKLIYYEKIYENGLFKKNIIKWVGEIKDG